MQELRLRFQPNIGQYPRCLQFEKDSRTIHQKIYNLEQDAHATRTSSAFERDSSGGVCLRSFDLTLENDRWTRNVDSGQKLNLTTWDLLEESNETKSKRCAGHFLCYDQSRRGLNAAFTQQCLHATSQTPVCFVLKKHDLFRRQLDVTYILPSQQASSECSSYIKPIHLVIQSFN